VILSKWVNVFLYRTTRCAAAACITLAGAAAQSANPIPAPTLVQGAGASFPSQVYSRWAQAFQKEAGIPVRYKPTSSADGLAQITAQAVHFGGSDTPLPSEELLKRNLVQVPMLVGGIVPVVNLPGIANGRLQLSGDVLAGVMSGKVPQWNDPSIAKLNPGVALPALPIHRVVRSDKSGTTEGFTRYLAGVSETFKRDVGVGQQPPWPGVFQGAEGNDGMVAALKAQPGAIAYVSFDRAEREGLAMVKLRNASGRFVAASEEGFRAAIQESDLAKQGDDLASLMDRPGPLSWPITMTSFVLFSATPEKGEEAGPAMKFLYWCLMHGDHRTRGTGFAPLPVILQSRMAGRFMAVRPKDHVTPDYFFSKR
jgi:phosphate transport system substrate-binding protein